MQSAADGTMRYKEHTLNGRKQSDTRRKAQLLDVCVVSAVVKWVTGVTGTLPDAMASPTWKMHGFNARSTLESCLGDGCQASCTCDQL